ncbi:hypothetical protein GCM10011583_48220 [Streptomyces camponoticapitis]|uniref:GntR family transcriptional regulator n=1 Tax=Streptomyces camponoticapitis TaxID=1616125 RepID=A0ABQ2EJ76_9ACTN|nr:hypothetical protein [Streptomyces camponoticapitis]GGK10446.1 hypothetical protein GCM10011583_48220 [Streptomyces camponoticapitis]
MVAWLPPDLDEAAVVAASARRGVALRSVARYRLNPAGPGGLIFGYATLSERAIAEGIATLSHAVADVRTT